MARGFLCNKLSCSHTKKNTQHYLVYLFLDDSVMGSIYLLKCKATKSLDYLIINVVSFLISRITCPSISVTNTYEHIIFYYGCNFTLTLIQNQHLTLSIISARLHLSSPRVCIYHLYTFTSSSSIELTLRMQRKYPAQSFRLMSSSRANVDVMNAQLTKASRAVGLHTYKEALNGFRAAPPMRGSLGMASERLHECEEAFG